MENTSFPYSVNQTILLTRHAEIIAQKGKLFQKTKGVYAIVAKGGENIVTITSDGKETQNIAKKGAYIVTNDTTAREKYIVTADEFNDRYELKQDGYYVPQKKARVYALQLTAENISRYRLDGFEKLMTNAGQPIYIEAPWHESQAVRLNDFLVSPVTKDKVYRIAQIEFGDTYSLVEKA